MLGNNDCAQKVTTVECCKLQHFTVPVSSFWLPYSTYLHLDFHLCSMTKLKEHSREICYVSSRMYSFKYLRLKIQVQIKTQIQAAQISAVETCHSCVIGENLNNLQKSRYPTKLAAPSSLGADILWVGGGSNADVRHCHALRQFWVVLQ